MEGTPWPMEGGGCVKQEGRGANSRLPLPWRRKGLLPSILLLLVFLLLWWRRATVSSIKPSWSGSSELSRKSGADWSPPPRQANLLWRARPLPPPLDDLRASLSSCQGVWAGDLAALCPSERLLKRAGFVWFWCMCGVCLDCGRQDFFNFQLPPPPPAFVVADPWPGRSSHPCRVSFLGFCSSTSNL